MNPTIATLVFRALSIATTSTELRSPSKARRIAMNTLVLIARIEGKMGRTCPASVHNTRSALETALLQQDDTTFGSYLEAADQEAKSCEVLSKMTVESV